jgi:Mor family transcriptional regulator
MPDIAPQYPEILVELTAIVAATLVDEGVDAGDAHGLSRAVVERVRKAWGGQKIYVPSGKSADVDRMRREIGERWNGTNTRELCAEFGISESRLRQLVDEWRSRKAPQLF